MLLASGTRLGVYEVLSAIGAGGMGEVYTARDTRLQRDVAVKVLPHVFASDADRLARLGAGGCCEGASGPTIPSSISNMD